MNNDGVYMQVVTLYIFTKIKFNEIFVLYLYIENIKNC